MFDDDLEPKNKPAQLKNMEPLSLDELDDYIDDLKSEIVRAQGEIERKKASMSAASSFFKS